MLGSNINSKINKAIKIKKSLTISRIGSKIFDVNKSISYLQLIAIFEELFFIWKSKGLFK